MGERFTNLTDSQLTVANIIMGALCVVSVLLFGMISASGAAEPLLASVGIAGPQNVGEPTPTPDTAAVLPPTWTPRATETASPTSTTIPSPTNTPTEEATATPEESPTPTVTETPEPDYAATIAAAQSATPVRPPDPPAPPPPTSPPPPVAPPPQPVAPTPIPPPFPAIPTAPPAPPPPPTNPPAPTPTPLPLYVLSDLRGGPDCAYSGISGTILNSNGTPRPDVQVDVFNESGFIISPITNASGYYEAYLDSQPRPDLAGYWHLRVMENGIQQSNEIIVIMSGNCTTGETRFVANFFRSQ